MTNHAASQNDRSGFTLLEVLISIFILGTGILSVFSLFMAGRSLQAYYHRQNAARNFASSTAVSVAKTWLAEDLVGLMGDGNEENPYNPAAPPPGSFEAGTYLVDPVGLNMHAGYGPYVGNQWNIAFPENGDTKAIPRLAVNSRVSAEVMINNLAGIDDLGYELSDPTNPDAAWLVRSFYGGRQRRDQAYHHALFVTSLPMTAASPGALLIFKDRPVPTGDDDDPVPSFDAISPEYGWPVGVVRLHSGTAIDSAGTVTAIENATADGDIRGEILRDCLRPKKWGIIRGLKDNSFQFSRVMSVIKTETDVGYTVIFAEKMEGDQTFGNIGDNSAGVECYFDASLVHIEQFVP